MTTLKTFLGKDLNRFRSLWVEEAARMTILLNKTTDSYTAEKLFLLVATPKLTDEQKKLALVKCEWRRATLNFTRTKIRAWEQLYNNAKDPHLLDQLNEHMDEWLQTSWAFLGQENIKEQSEDAKAEFEMFKTLLYLTDDKPKKKTRRGGKKNKK